jgi:hypothetical protein
MPEPRIGTRQEWQETRDELLRLEQEHIRLTSSHAEDASCPG